MNDFELELWEVPVGVETKLVASAEAKAKSLRGELLLRSVRVAPARFVVFARWQNANFLLLRVHAGNYHSLEPALWKTRSRKHKLERIAELIGNTQRLPGQEFELALFMVVRDETGVATNAVVRQLSWNSWNGGAKGAWVSDDFTTPIYFDFAHQNDTRQSLQMALAQPDSQARLAWNWTHLDEKERAQRLTLSQERLREIRRIGPWVMQSVPSLWEHSDAPNLRITARGAFIQLNSRASLGDTPKEREFLSAWVEEMQKIFDSQDALVLKLARFGSFTELINLHLVVSAPTQHERLEAGLGLREWLGLNAPDKIETLLPS